MGPPSELNNLAFIDTRSLSQDTRIEADVCVIGSGAAGFAIASHLLDRSRRVVLLALAFRLADHLDAKLSGIT